MANTNPNEKKCVECYSDIPLKARKCVHCGAYQTSWRYISFSSTFLALLIALLSVAGTTLPPLVSAIKDGTNISVTLTAAENLEITTFIKNTGQRAGVVFLPYVSVCLEGEECDYFASWRNLEVRFKDFDGYVGGGQSKIVKLLLTEDACREIGADSQESAEEVLDQFDTLRASCLLRYRVQDFLGLLKT